MSPTEQTIGNMLGVAIVVAVGWYFFHLTAAQCYMTWLIVVAGRNARK